SLEKARHGPATSMHFKVDDVRIREIKELAPPALLLREFPCSEKTEELTYNTRQAIHRLLHGSDDRILVIIGPCSIHDAKAGLEYARRLVEMRKELERDLVIVMRVYFEKPRTTVGWKGLINDPDLDGSFQINKGLRLARELLMDINEAGLPAGTEFLDMISPQYYADLVSWGAIGARTTESQVHRARLRAVVRGRLQERHRRERAHRGRRAEGCAHSPPCPFGDQGGALRHRLDQRKRGLPHHPARRKTS